MLDNAKLENITEAIESYRKNRPSTLSFWSRWLDPTRGLNRAAFYLQLLKTPDLNVLEFNMIIYALLASADGNTLQEHVLKKLGYKDLGDMAKARLALMKKIKDEINIHRKNDHAAFVDTLNDVNQAIGKIVKYANSDGEYTEINQKKYFDFLNNLKYKKPRPTQFTICNKKGWYHNFSILDILNAAIKILKTNSISYTFFKTCFKYEQENWINIRTVYFGVYRLNDEDTITSTPTNFQQNLKEKFQKYLDILKTKFENNVIPENYTFIFISMINDNHFAVYACNFRGEIIAINSMGGSYRNFDNAAIEGLSNILYQNNVTVQVNNIFKLTPSESDQYRQKDSSICGGIAVAMALAISYKKSFKEQFERLKNHLIKLCGLNSEHYNDIRSEQQHIINLISDKDTNMEDAKKYINNCEYTVTAERFEEIEENLSKSTSSVSSIPTSFGMR